MKTLQSLFLTALFVGLLPFGARAAVPDVPPIAAQPAQGTCEKCKRGGEGASMDHDMDHANMNHAGMSCCAGKRDGASSGCKRCSSGGMDGMEMGDMKMDGMHKACGGMQGLGARDTAALERRIAELEKRLDLMQRLVTESRRR